MKPLFFSPTAHRSGQADPGVSLPSATSAVGQQMSKDVVGSIRLSDVEQELDETIRELGQKMVQADQDGDPTGRDIFRDRMYAAMRSRTLRHQAKLIAHTDEGVDYFSAQGALAAYQLAKAEGRVE